MAFASEKIYNFIKNYEKFKGTLYNDAGGNATIGYGHLVHFGKVGTNSSKELPFLKGISEYEAYKFLKMDVREKAESYVNRCVKVPISQHQYDALISFSFNVGGGNFVSSSLLKMVNSKTFDPTIITNCFMQWNKARIGGQLKVLDGLSTRRRQEADIFNKNIYVSTHH